MIPTFNQALAEHGSAKEAIFQCLRLACHNNGGCLQYGYDSAAQWVLDNAPAIVAHLSGTVESRIAALETQALFPFQGHPNDIGFVELEKRLQALEDVLARVERDVALLKDENIVANMTIVDQNVWRKFRDTSFGTEPTTPEARKLLGLDVEKPESKIVCKWVGEYFHIGDECVGAVLKDTDGEWLGCCNGVSFADSPLHTTESKARAWVEAQFNNPKTNS